MDDEFVFVCLRTMLPLTVKYILLALSHPCVTCCSMHFFGHCYYCFVHQIVRRAPMYVIYPGGALALAYFSIKRAEALTAAEDYSHRP
jgi:hypothetical protein